MAPGLATQKAEQYQGKVTTRLIITCIIAAIGGLIFGYVGITGQVTVQEGILDFFFNTVNDYYDHSQNNYCKYNKKIDIAYMPSLYLPALIASLVASPVTKKHGRKKSIIIAGVSFCIGAAIMASTQRIFNVVGLILGRIVLGVGLGFGNQAIPLYLSEMAPMHFRGGLNLMFQLAISLGILTANIVNYATPHQRSWSSDANPRQTLSYGLVAGIAFLMTVGAIFLSETANSLVQQGSKDKGRKVLEKIRGTENVDPEFQDIVDASDSASTVKHPFRSIFQKRNRPQLLIAILMPIFQAHTGIYSLLYYAPIFFLNMGFGDNGAVYSSAIIGAVLVSSALLSMATVDRFGRRALLISGGIQMIICQVTIAIILGLKLKDHQELSRSLSIVVMVVICLFVLAFGWSWGPLGWTIPSEIFPLEIRSAGQSITVAVNFLFTYIVTQSFLPLLCTFRYGTFLFYTGWIIVMTTFVYLFLPETKGVPIEEMTSVWRKHWFWKRMVPAEQEQTLP